jgi:hypothetical protein
MRPPFHDIWWWNPTHRTSHGEDRNLGVFQCSPYLIEFSAFQHTCKTGPCTPSAPFELEIVEFQEWNLCSRKCSPPSYQLCFRLEMLKRVGNMLEMCLSPYEMHFMCGKHVSYGLKRVSRLYHASVEFVSKKIALCLNLIVGSHNLCLNA